MTIEWRSDITEPVRRAAVRLFRPYVRIVTGGIAIYALFSIFPLIYPALTLLTVFLRPELAVQLAAPISSFFSQNVEALSTADVDVIGNMTPAGLSLRAFGALILVLITATSGARAAITGIRMIAGTAGRTGFARFKGVSLLLTGSLVLLVWLPGALRLIITEISAEGGCEIGQFAGEIAAVAETLWISKAVAGFAIFYLILVLSLRGHLNRGTKAIAAGAAAGTTAFVFVTFLFQLHLNYSVIGTLYGALASLIFGFVWLSASVMSLLLGAAQAAEWSQAWGEDGADAAA